MAVRRGGTVESVHRVHAVARARRRVVAVGRRPGPRHVPPLVGEAAPGAAARARPARPRRPSGRDRLRVAPRRARADRGGARPARGRRRDRGRPRGRAPGGPAARADLPQLLGQARGDARRLPRARLAHGRLPAARAPAAAGHPRRGDRGRRAHAGHGHRPLLGRHLRVAARGDGGRILAPRRARGQRTDPGGDASASRPDRRRGLAGHAAHAVASGLAGEGRRGGRFSAGSRPTASGFALKCEDGAFRALGPALSSFFPGLEEFARVPVENSRGEEVGEVVAG